MNDVILDSLKAIVGDNGWREDKASLEPHVTEWRGLAHGRTPIMLLPSSTEMVSRILKLCNEHAIGVVPQGGNTGLCGGAIPDSSNSQIIVNLGRMNRIREFNAENFSMTVEAGCVLGTLQREAEVHNRHFPLSLAAEGSCQIGGNLSTDAGGINVIRYGTARDQVLGLEVVLANGDILSGLRGLRKDTAGYDLKQLFIGSEGTLGIITAATLKLHPDPGPAATAMVAIREARDSVGLLALMRERCGDSIEAFELLSGTARTFVRRHIGDARDPLGPDEAWGVLMELRGEDIASRQEQALAEAIESGLAMDAVIAKSSSEAEEFWLIRHSISAAQKFEGASIKHDIAVPIDRIPELLVEGDVLIQRVLPGGRLCAFGHVGDGNLHYNVSQPVDEDPAAFRSRGVEFTAALYELVDQLGGTFSAEHGVGVFKKDYLEMFRSPAEIRLMKTLKSGLDPKNILNPGKVLTTGSAPGT